MGWGETFAILPKIKGNLENSLFHVVEKLTKTEAEARVPWFVAPHKPVPGMGRQLGVRRGGKVIYPVHIKVLPTGKMRKWCFPISPKCTYCCLSRFLPSSGM